MEEAKDAKFSGRVLVVDDDKNTLTIHKMALASQFEVEVTYLGEKALSIC